MEAQKDFGGARAKKQQMKLFVPEGSFRLKVMHISVYTKKSNSPLSKYFCVPPEENILFMDQLIRTYKLQGNLGPLSNFTNFCSSIMTTNLCKKAFKYSIEQGNSKLWYHLRYGRITASKFYEAAHCSTDGVLVETILGAMSFKSVAMKRGQLLEKEVREMLKVDFPNIKECGIMLRTNYPIYAASPDGIDSNYVFEIKCPFKENTKKNYLKDGVINPKYMGQIQLQMLMTQRTKGVFCVASPNFEFDKQIEKVIVNFDSKLCQNYIEKCDLFWFKYVYPKLIE